MLYGFIRRVRVILLLLVSLGFNSSQRNIPIKNIETVLVKGDSCSLCVSVWMSRNMSMYSFVYSNISEKPALDCYRVDGTWYKKWLVFCYGEKFCGI